MRNLPDRNDLIPEWFKGLFLIQTAYAFEHEPPHREFHTTTVTYCKTQTGDGAPGGAGSPGTNGKPGGRGGDSARVLVIVDDPTLFQVEPHATPGLGGPGGYGGAGGTGGAGGDPGDRRCGECRVANPGRPGAAGPNGQPGAKGANGTEQPICLRMGPQAKFGNCESFQ